MITFAVCVDLVADGSSRLILSDTFSTKFYIHCNKITMKLYEDQQFDWQHSPQCAADHPHQPHCEQHEP